MIDNAPQIDKSQLLFLISKAENNVWKYSDSPSQLDHKLSVLETLVQLGLDQKEIDKYLHEHDDEAGQKYSDVFLSVGELSQLVGVSKQLLIYYDKYGLFSPKVIADNGYRYYTLDQCHTAELIVNLRKMDVPLESIQKYLESKSSNNLIQLYENSLQDFEAKIQELQNKKRLLIQKVEQLKNNSNLVLNKPEIIEIREDRLFYALPIPLTLNLKKDS